MEQRLRNDFVAVSIVSHLFQRVLYTVIKTERSKRISYQQFLDGYLEPAERVFVCYEDVVFPYTFYKAIRILGGTARRYVHCLIDLGHVDIARVFHCKRNRRKGE